MLNYPKKKIEPVGRPNMPSTGVEIAGEIRVAGARPSENES